MSLSGISVHEDVISKYNEMRYKKEEMGLVLKINENAVVIESKIASDFTGMVSKLPDNEPRYVLYDIPLKNRANLDVLKTSFIFWMPMESPVRLRMQYASTKSEIIKNFRGIAMQTQEDDKADLTLEKMVKKINKTQGINNPSI